MGHRLTLNTQKSEFSMVVTMILRGKVVGSEIPRFKHRWFGILEVEVEGVCPP